MTTKQRISNIIEKWYLIDPLFFAVWTTHELSINPNIQNIRVGRGQVEYNPTFIEALDDQTLYQVLQFEAMRIILKHPYLRRKENQTVAYTASNITIQEYLQTPLNFPYAKQIFQTDEYDKKYFEFYYYKLLEQQDSMGQSAAGGQPDEGGESGAQEQYTDPETSGIENTESWDADEYYSNQINDKIESALENNSWGTLPSHIQELILATLKPKINYREILRSFRASIISVNRVLTRMKP
ncbi:hypothetical protein THIOM_003755, partial [Candidatus Thiomargarita nelsonii]